MGGTVAQDQPHAGALSDLRCDHCTDALADFQRLAPQPAGHGHHLPVRRHFAAGVCDPGGALRFVAIPFGEDREPAAQDRHGLQRASGSGEGRALKARRLAGLTFDPWRWRGQSGAAGHGFENRHGAVALFDGDTELDALYQPFQTLGIIALFGTDHALGHDAAGVGQRQHDAAVQALNAQIDLVVRRESIGNDLKWVVHDASPPD